MFKSARLFAGVILVVVTCVAVSAQTMDKSKTTPVANAVEALRGAMVSGNEKELNALVDDHLTYGHSHGKLQNKAEFVKSLVGPKAPGKFNWIKLSNQTIDIVGKIALVRHTFDAQNEGPDGKITKAHILVLQVWTKEKGGWKLLARQACPLD
jgi:ketosteroid isomerase-like protein